MTPSKPPPFFTWILTDIEDQSDVPERMRQYMRMLWLNGVPVEEIAETFKMPIEWVDDFVREAERTARPH